MVDIATGPLRPYSDVLYTKPGTEPQNDFVSNLCNQQMIRSIGQFQSFSVFGIAIILASSTFFILLSFVIDSITAWVQRWTHRGKERRLQWLLDDSLQLQRMAYVGAGEGSWDSNPESIPLTRKGTFLKPSLHLPANEHARTTV